MASAPIINPKLFTTRLPWVQQRAAVTDGSNTFVAGQFVYITSAALAQVPAAGTLLYGLTLDPSHAATDETYLSIFGENHNPVSANGAQFLINITDSAGTVGAAGSAGGTSQASVTIGTFYPLIYLASPYATIQALNSTASGTAAQNILKVVGFYNTTISPSDGDASADFNGRAIVEILGTALQ